MMVQLNGVNGRNYSIVVNDLCGAIIPDQSSVKVDVHATITICVLIQLLLFECWVYWQFKAFSLHIHAGERWQCHYFAPEGNKRYLAILDWKREET